MSTGNSFDPLNYAHFYASVGLRVVPIWGIDANGHCMCRDRASCSSAGKHPIPSKGFHEATTDRAQLAKWWQANPHANVGIATSAGFTIVDIDVKSGGLQTFDALVTQYGEDIFKSPYRVRTGAGGLHLAFRSPAGTTSRNGVLPGIDRKAEGGMVVAAFSRHRSGNHYQFEPSIRALDLSTLGPLPTVFLGAAPNVQPPTQAPNGKIAEGSRNATLTSIAGKLRERGLAAAEIEASLRSLNQTVCAVPLPDAEVVRIAASVAKYGAGVPASFSFIGADELVATTPPQIDWIVPGLVALGAVTEIIGHPKSGKSTLVRAMVAALIHSRPFLGMTVRPCRVVMLSEERDGTLSCAVAEHKIATGDLRLLQRHRVAGTPSWPEVIEAALGEVKRLGAELLVVDTLPFWSLGESDENSASDGMKAMEPLLRVAAEGVAVLSLRHMRKSGGDTVSAARGASSITGAADIVCTLAAHVAGDTFRVIDSTGRFKESVFKLVIELTPSGYVAHGNGQQVAQQAQLALENLVISLLPNDEQSALAERDILPLLAKTPTPIGRTKLAEVLKGLVIARAIECKGRGTNNDPKRYWAP